MIKRLIPLKAARIIGLLTRALTRIRPNFNFQFPLGFRHRAAPIELNSIRFLVLVHLGSNNKTRRLARALSSPFELISTLPDDFALALFANCPSAINLVRQYLNRINNLGVRCLGGLSDHYLVLVHRYLLLA